MNPSMNPWGFNPETILVVLTGLLVIGVIVALFQLRSAELARKANLFFRLLENYEKVEAYEGVKLLSDESKTFRTIAEFEMAFREDGRESDAHVARRRVKFMLAPYGYMLKFRLAKPKELFPVLPAAINLWGKGLAAVEHELLEKNKRKREYQLGYDLVALVDYLYEQYDAQIRGSR